MIVTSNRAGTMGDLDLWVSSRGSTQEPWSPLVNVNTDNVAKEGAAVVNTTA